MAAFLITRCGIVSQALSQQFNSDNCVTMPKGVNTFILTVGQCSSTVLGTVAPSDRFGLDMGVNGFAAQPSEGVSAYYSTVIYGPWKYYQNKSDTGGLSLMGQLRNRLGLE